MSPDRKKEEEQKKRKKNARKEINAIYKWIKANCNRLEKFDALMEKVKRIQPVLEDYGDILNANLVQDIEIGIKKIDKSSGDIHQFCDLADRLKDLSNTLYNPFIPHWVQDLLPATGGAGLVIGIVTAAVILGAVITAFSPLVQTTIEVNNQGCEPIAAPQGLPNIPGVSFWKKPIPDGGLDTAKIPPFIQIGVDATQENTVGISIFSLGPIPLPMAGVKSILLDGREIKGQIVSETLGIRKIYLLVISCR